MLSFTVFVCSGIDGTWLKFPHLRYIFLNLLGYGPVDREDENQTIT